MTSPAGFAERVPGRATLPRVASLNLRRVAQDQDLLILAACLLPGLAGTGPLLSSDLHSTLFEAARHLGYCGTAGAHRAADHGEAVLVRDLIARGELAADRLVSRRLHGWLMHQSVKTVVQAL